MKKFLILLVILGVCVYIFKDELNPKGALINKLNKFNEIENIYYQTDISYKFLGQQETTITLKQFKKGNNYNAKFSNPMMRSEANLELKNGNIRYNEYFMTVEGSVNESKADKSFFWLDKITSDDINKDTIKKLETPDNLSTLNCKMYSSELKKDKNKIDICINKENIPVYIKYYNIDFIPLLFSTNPITSLTEHKGDVILKLTDIKLNPAYDTSFDVKTSKYGLTMTVKELKDQIAEQQAMFNEINESMDDLKSLMNDLNNLQNTEDIHY